MKRIVCSSVVASLLVGLMMSPSSAQEAATKKPVAKKPVVKKQADQRKRVNPAMLPPEVQSDLPNVLLIGDSISIGYMVPARKQLAGAVSYTHLTLPTTPYV